MRAVTITLIFEDEEANPAVAVQKAEKLFQVEKVDFLTGTVNSGSTLAVAQLAERNDRLAATTVSFADSITGDKCSPNMFRVNARAEQQSVALAAWLEKEKPKSKVFYLGPDYEMGRSTVAAFKTNAEKSRRRDRWARCSRLSIPRTTRSISARSGLPSAGRLYFGCRERHGTAVDPACGFRPVDRT